MLRRPPTAIKLTSEDVAAYEDSLRAKRLAAAQAAQNQQSLLNQQSAQDPTDNQNSDPNGTPKKEVVLDPNDELRPLPGEKARIARTREERIGMAGRS